MSEAETRSEETAKRKGVFDGPRPASMGRGPRFGPAASALLSEGIGASAVRLVAVTALGALAVSFALAGIRPDAAEPRQAVKAPVVLPMPVVAEPAETPVDVRPMRLEGFSTQLRDLELTGAEPALIRPVPVEPEAVCAAFAAAGWKTGRWKAGALGSSGGECSAERTYGAEGKAKSSRAFALLRGRDAEALREIRIKLNLYDEATRSAAASDAAALVGSLFDLWNWNGADKLGARIAALEPFEEDTLGTTIRFWREHGDVERFNLVLTLPEPALRAKPGTLLPVSKAQERVAASIPR